MMYQSETAMSNIHEDDGNGTASESGFIELPCRCDNCLYTSFWRNYQLAAETQNQEEIIVVEVCDRWTQTDPVDDDDLESNYSAYWTPGTLEHVILQQEMIKTIQRYNLSGARDPNCAKGLDDIIREVKLPDTEETRKALKLRISRTISFNRFYHRKRAEAIQKGTRLQNLLYNGKRKHKKERAPSTAQKSGNDGATIELSRPTCTATQDQSLTQVQNYPCIQGHVSGVYAQGPSSDSNLVLQQGGVAQDNFSPHEFYFPNI